MDIKTLEYLEERSRKARAIVDSIADLTSRVELIKKSRGVIDLYTPKRSHRIEIESGFEDNKALNNFETELAAHIYNTYIKVILAEIRQLEKQLAEL